MLDSLQALGIQNVQVYVQTAGIKDSSCESDIMKGFSYNTRSDLGAWGWTLNVPPGNDSGLAGFHETNASTCMQLTLSFLKLFSG